MSQDEPTRRSPHLHSDATGNSLSAQDTSSKDFEGMKTVNARSDAETAASGKRVKVFHASTPEEEQARRHRALGNEDAMVREEETSAEAEGKEQSNKDEDASTATTSSAIHQIERDHGADLADSNDVNMDDDESPKVSTVPLAEETDEEWWDLKMQWGGKVYDIHVGGNDM